MNYILTSLTHYLLSRKHLIGVLNFIANKNFWLILVIRNILYKPARADFRSHGNNSSITSISVSFSVLLIEIIVLHFLIGKGIYVNGPARFFEYLNNIRHKCIPSCPEGTSTQNILISNDVSISIILYRYTYLIDYFVRYGA